MAPVAKATFFTAGPISRKYSSGRSARVLAWSRPFMIKKGLKLFDSGRTLGDDLCMTLRDRADVQESDAECGPERLTPHYYH